MGTTTNIHHVTHSSSVFALSDSYWSVRSRTSFFTYSTLQHEKVRGLSFCYDGTCCVLVLKEVAEFANQKNSARD